MKPQITIDRQALRFMFTNGEGMNLFWADLFSPKPHITDFQAAVMENLHRMYDECVRLDIKPETEMDDILDTTIPSQLELFDEEEYNELYNFEEYDD